MRTSLTFAFDLCELARSFGVEEYTPLLASTIANETRLKTASEFGPERTFCGSILDYLITCLPGTYVYNLTIYDHPLLRPTLSARDAQVHKRSERRLNEAATRSP
jgi:hypothetical protein